MKRLQSDFNRIKYLRQKKKKLVVVITHEHELKNKKKARTNVSNIRVNHSIIFNSRTDNYYLSYSNG